MYELYNSFYAGPTRRLARPLAPAVSLHFLIH